MKMKISVSRARVERVHTAARWVLWNVVMPQKRRDTMPDILRPFERK